MRSSALCTGASLLAMLLASGASAQAPGERPAATAPSPDAPAKPATPPPPQPEAKPSAPAPSKTPGTAATVVNLKTIEGVMGKAVRSRTGNEDMGHIVDVLIDGAAQPRAAVIDFGGFLGVGSRKVAVAWKTLDFADSIQSGSVKVSLTRDQVRQAPEYKADEPVVVLEDAAPAQPKDAAQPKNAAAQAPAAPPPSPPGHNETAPAR